MKKICFIITDAISYETLCNGQFEYFKESQQLDMTFIGGGEEEFLQKLRDRDVGKVKRIDFTRKPDLIKDISCLISLWFYLIFNRFDVVVYSTPKALLLGSIASFFSLQKRRVSIFRGRVYENYTGSKRTFFAYLDKLCLITSSQNMFISESLLKKYEDENLIKPNTGIILNNGSSNGVNAQLFVPSETKEKNKKFHMIMVGRICKDKGIYELSQLLVNIKDLPFTLTIVGKIECEDSENILEEILHNYKNVEYIKFTHQPISLFQQADLHIFLSHREGFGNVAIEAASCGVPTYAFDVTGVKDSVKNDISGKKFVFGDIDAMAKEIEWSINNYDKFKNKYLTCREWIVKNFDNNTIWAGYLEFFTKK